MTSYLMVVIVLFFRSVTISEIFIVETCKTLTMTFRTGQEQCRDCPYTTYYLLAIVIVTLYATISKVFIVKVCTTLTLTFRMFKHNYKYANTYKYANMPIHESLFVGNSIFIPSVTIFKILIVKYA